MFIGVLMYCFRFIMEVSKNVIPLLTKRFGYGMMTGIPTDSAQILSDRYLIELYFNLAYKLKGFYLLYESTGNLIWKHWKRK